MAMLMVMTSMNTMTISKVKNNKTPAESATAEKLVAKFE